MMKNEKKLLLEVKDVCMEFNLASQKVDNIKEFFILKVKNELKYQRFCALRNISFEMEPGDSVAIVGLNGSGKSTLLKVIAGILKPTKGTAGTNGRIAPLIELGAGFDMDLTARENVFLCGALMGYSHRELAESYEEIVDFAELKDFMEVPLKNFSTGMLARLGFSLATVRDPDLLIIDEVLTVGDHLFQEKCRDRIDSIRKKGVGVLFVSHNMDQVIDLCDRAIWLDAGEMRMIGNAPEVTAAYLEEGRHD